MSNKNKVELLAPAGNFEKMKYAFAYGADAVYLGVPAFSMRYRLNGFSLDILKKAVDYAHNLNKKVYVTVNIVAHNYHLQSAIKHLRQLNKIKPDALIISDPGIMVLAKKYAPDCELHLSTQANATNWLTVKFWRDQGFSRVILGREVSLTEITEITKKVKKIDLEMFVHGAMCMSYSGRCMLSAWLVGRSANLGDCVQPCRWQYNPKQIEYHSFRVDLEDTGTKTRQLEVEQDMNGTYIFNANDLCLIEYLPEILKTGVKSLKIEGRTKSVAYISAVVKAYRLALDYLQNDGYNEDIKKQKRELKKIKKKYLDHLINRGYNLGFAFGREQAKQNIVNSHNLSDEQFVGQILAKKQVKSEIYYYLQVHNALRVNDKIRIIQPQANDVNLNLKHIYTDEGEEIASAHGGTGKLYLLKSKRDLQIKSILFKKKHD